MEEGAMKRDQFVALLAVACSTFYMLTVSVPASAEIKRHCKMSYKLALSQGIKTDGMPFFLIAPLQEAHVPLKFVNPDGPANPDDFMQASGKCGNTVPNRCRRRAAAKLKKCAEDQFNNNLSVRPGSCGVVKNYLQGTSMKAFIEAKACKRLGNTYSKFTYLQAPQSYTITARPQVTISGDKGCNQTLVFDYFTVQCGQ